MVFKLLLLATLIAVISNAQQPVISNVAISDLEHGSVRVYFDVTPDAYTRILFDTVSHASSGAYEYNTAFSVTAGNFSAFSIGALKPSTTYYYVVTASNSANNTSPVQSAEYSFTTPADPGHPVLPESPVVYNPAELNLSGYTIVPMTNGSSDCVAAQAVNAPAGNSSWAGNVAAGMTVQTVLDTVGYGTILDFAQGALCKVPADPARYNSGYVLSPKIVDPQASSIDDPNHRWIVIQTHQNATTDLPPVGVRTSSSWDSKLAAFIAQTPASVVTANMYSIYAAGQLFDLGPGVTHHIWIQNVKLSVDSSTAGTFGPYINLGANSCVSGAPKYIVVEQAHIIGAPVPGSSRSQSAIMGCPNYLAVRNNSIEGFDVATTTGQYPTSTALYFTDYSLGRYQIDNNFFQAVGQNIYFEANEYATIPTNHDDVVITHNYLSWPLYTLNNPRNSVFDGNPRNLRNQFETKRGRRLLFAGNIIDGQWSYQNEGSAIFLSGTKDYYTGNTGVTDATIRDNIIRHSANVFNCFGTHFVQPDNSVIRRISFSNNLAHDLGRWSYDAGGPSLYSGYIESLGGCQDMVIRQNTFGFTNADSGSLSFTYIPQILAVGGGTQLSEGFYFQNNIAFFSIDNPSSYAGITNNGDEESAVFPRMPQTKSNNSFAGVLDTAMVQLDGSAQGTPNAVWGQNVVVGGTIPTAEPWQDLSASDVTYYSAGPGGTMPAGDTYASGSTMASRTMSAGLLNTANNDYTCTPVAQNPANSQGQCSAGADVAQIYSAAGVVTALTVTPASTNATFAYTAPDSRVCSVDYGLSGSYTSRLTDTGGTTSRSVAASGLQPSTTYSYRLLCYFEQGPGTNVPDGVATNGTFTTLASSLSVLTTYLIADGTPSPTYGGPTQIVPARAYNPGGAANISTMWIYLEDPATSSIHQSYTLGFSSGSYIFSFVDNVLNLASWPYITMMPDGVTHSVNALAGNINVVSYRLALVGNELQLDLGVTNTGTFNDKITLGAAVGSTYSVPWISTAAGQWNTP